MDWSPPGSLSLGFFRQEYWNGLPEKPYRKSLTEIVQSLMIKGPVSAFGYFHKCPRGGAPFLEVLQYQVDAWSGRSKLLFQLPAPKIHLIYCPRIEDVSDIKLIRTDTTLDLSQKAEKRYRRTARRCHRPAVDHVSLSVTRVPAHSRAPCLCLVDTAMAAPHQTLEQASFSTL